MLGVAALALAALAVVKLTARKPEPLSPAAAAYEPERVSPTTRPNRPSELLPPVWLTGAGGDAPSVDAGGLARWELSREALDVAGEARVPYQLADYNHHQGCSDGMRPLMTAVQNLLRDEFPTKIARTEGWVCRTGPTALNAARKQLSIHAVGRALDIFVAGQGAAARHNGDEVANWLVQHAVQLRIQLIIWYRTQWRPNGRPAELYRGKSPHIEHLHIEVSERPAGEHEDEPPPNVGDEG